MDRVLSSTRSSFLVRAKRVSLVNDSSRVYKKLFNFAERDYESICRFGAKEIMKETTFARASPFRKLRQPLSVIRVKHELSTWRKFFSRGGKWQEKREERWMRSMLVRRETKRQQPKKPDSSGGYVCRGFPRKASLRRSLKIATSYQANNATQPIPLGKRTHTSGFILARNVKSASRVCSWLDGHASRDSRMSKDSDCRLKFHRDSITLRHYSERLSKKIKKSNVVTDRT